ncbi:MAG: RNA 3'-terminal phosphate cyclase, partial [Dehalococcoidia bacterium]
FHYLTEVLLPILSHLGYRAESKLKRWGWYPRGGGEVELRVEPLMELKQPRLEERGELKAIRGISAASNLPSHVVERQARRVRERLDQCGLPLELEMVQPSSTGPGSLVFLVALSKKGIGGFSSLGARGKRAETVADEAVEALLRYLETGCAIEEHLADQLIPFLALADGNASFTTSRISQHLLTNLWVVQQFLPVKFEVEGQEGTPGKVTKIS